MTESQLKDEDAIAARLTLAALQEICPPADSASQPLWYHLPPSPKLLSADQVTSRLRELPKPIVCFGYSIARGFVVCTWPLVAEYRRRGEMLREFANAIREDLGVAGRDRLLVRTAAGDMYVSADHIEAWFAQYYLPHLQMSFGDETGEPGVSDDTHVMKFRQITTSIVQSSE